MPGRETPPVQCPGRVSLVLCAATVPLWVLSYIYPNLKLAALNQRSIWLRKGYAVCDFYDPVVHIYPPLERRKLPSPLGVLFYAKDPNGRIIFWQIRIPIWVLTSSMMILPLARTTAYWYRKRRDSLRIGFCAGCGYDLRVQLALSEPNGRASKDRCPECGTAIPAAAEEARA